MKVYIKIEQTSGAGILSIRFPYFKNNALWYTDNDVVFTEITSSDFKYETKYTVDAIDTANLRLLIYELDSNQLVKTINIAGEAVSDTTALTIAVESISLGTGSTLDELISSTIAVTASNLIGDIIVTGSQDDSIYISGDDGATYYKDNLPIQAIVWVTATTFSLKIKRIYTTVIGGFIQSLVFTNSAASATLTVDSFFDNYVKALTLNTDPPVKDEGSIYFNSTDKHFYGYNGAIWKQLDN